MINAERLRRTFLDLVAFNSPHGQEREVSRYCADVLRDIGFVCQFDAAGNVDESKADVMWLSALLNDLGRADEGELAEALRPYYVDYLLKHEETGPVSD